MAEKVFFALWILRKVLLSVSFYFLPSSPVM